MSDLERHAHRGPADGDWLIHTHAGDLHRHTVRKETETGEFADIPYGYIEAVPDTPLQAIADAWNKDRGDVTIEYRAIVRGVMPELAALLDALGGTHEEWCSTYKNVGGCSCSQEADALGGTDDGLRCPEKLVDHQCCLVVGHAGMHEDENYAALREDTP